MPMERPQACTTVDGPNPFRTTLTMVETMTLVGIYRGIIRNEGILGGAGFRPSTVGNGLDALLTQRLLASAFNGRRDPSIRHLGGWDPVSKPGLTALNRIGASGYVDLFSPLAGSCFWYSLKMLRFFSIHAV